MEDHVKQKVCVCVSVCVRLCVCGGGRRQLNRDKLSTPPQNKTLHADKNHLYSLTDKEQREERGFT